MIFNRANKKGGLDHINKIMRKFILNNNRSEQDHDAINLKYRTLLSRSK